MKHWSERRNNDVRNVFFGGLFLGTNRSGVGSQRWTNDMTFFAYVWPFCYQGSSCGHSMSCSGPRLYVNARSTRGYPHWNIAFMLVFIHVFIGFAARGPGGVSGGGSGGLRGGGGGFGGGGGSGGFGGCYNTVQDNLRVCMRHVDLSSRSLDIKGSYT